MKNPKYVGKKTSYDDREYMAIFCETDLCIPSRYNNQRGFTYKDLVGMLYSPDIIKLKSLEVGQGFAPEPDWGRKKGYMSGWIRRVK